jgi:hypothetical protein
VNLSQAGFMDKVGWWGLIDKGLIGLNRFLTFSHATVHITLLDIGEKQIVCRKPFGTQLNLSGRKPSMPSDIHGYKRNKSHLIYRRGRQAVQRFSSNW